MRSDIRKTGRRRKMRAEEGRDDEVDEVKFECLQDLHRSIQSMNGLR